jgi:histidine triad (HIT) family protein
MAHDDCIFCKVLEGEIPSEQVDEDEHTVAFMDINPWTRGHALVIPRRHATNLYEIDDDELAHVAAGAKRLAKRMKETLGCDGVNLINSCEPAAWQTVFHFHIHVIPRYDDDPLQLPVRPERAEPDELARVAEELRGRS